MKNENRSLYRLYYFVFDRLSFLITFLLFSSCSLQRKISKAEDIKTEIKKSSSDSTTETKVSQSEKNATEKTNSTKIENAIFQLLDSLGRPSPNVYVYPKTQQFFASEKTNQENFKDSFTQLKKSLVDSLSTYKESKEIKKSSSLKLSPVELALSFVSIIFLLYLSRRIFLKIKNSPAGRFI